MIFFSIYLIFYNSIYNSNFLCAKKYGQLIKYWSLIDKIIQVFLMMFFFVIDNVTIPYIWWFFLWRWKMISFMMLLSCLKAKQSTFWFSRIFLVCITNINWNIVIFNLLDLIGNSILYFEIVKSVSNVRLTYKFLKNWAQIRINISIWR